MLTSPQNNFIGKATACQPSIISVCVDSIAVGMVIYMEMDATHFVEWFQNAPDAEKLLYDKVYDFGEFFKDMLFEKGTAPYDFIRCQVRVSDADGDQATIKQALAKQLGDEQEEWVEDDLRPHELAYFSYTYFKMKVDELKPGYAAYYDKKEQLLCVTPKAITDDVVILHEMIHLHEGVINDLPFNFHDVLYWALYQDLRKKIANLDDAISRYAHVLNESDLYSRGGLHDVLFLLKSFDLDIRQGYPFGTVLGYGQAGDFKSLKIIQS